MKTPATAPLICLLFLCCGAVSAVILNPPIIDLEIPAGGSKKATLTVINDGEENVDLRLYLTDISKTRNGTLQFPEAGVTEYSCADDIALEAEELLLKPSEQRDLDVIVSVPFGARGGRYAVVMCEVARNLEASEGIVIAPRLRLGCVVRVSVAGTESRKVAIGGLEYTPSSGAENGAIALTVRNSGNIHVSDGKGFLVVIDEDKRIVERVPLMLDAMVFPDSELEFEIPSQRRLRRGTYTAIVAFDFRGGASTSMQSSFVVAADSDGIREDAADTLRLGVEPALVELAVPAGGYRTLGLRLSNDEDVDLEIHITLGDVLYDSDGRPSTAPIGQTPYSLKDVAVVEPPRFELRAGSTRSIRLGFSVPKRKTGGMYGKLVLEARSMGSEYLLTGHKEVDVGVVVQGTSRSSARIENVELSTSSEAIDLRVRLLNEGNILLRPQGELRVDTMKDETVRSAAFGEVAVLPGEGVNMMASVPTLPSGRYRFSVALGYGPAGDRLSWSKEIDIQ